MSKIKNSIYVSDLKASLDRHPKEEMIYENVRKSFYPIASFYGFKALHISLLDGSRVFSGLARNKLISQPNPVILKTKEGEEVALRYSVVLSILRSFSLQHMEGLPTPVKITSQAEVFSAAPKEEIPWVQSIETSLVVIGEESPMAEAEMLQVVWKTAEDLDIRIQELNTVVNAIGCSECRPSFQSAISSHLRNRVARLCKDCKKSVKNSPTDIFSCKEEKCLMVSGSAPPILDFLCESCKKYLRGLLEFLDEAEISYLLDGKFFDSDLKYNKIIFQIQASISSASKPEEEKPSEKKIIVLAEGGRMSQLASQLIGRPTEVSGITMRLKEWKEFLKSRQKTGFDAEHDSPRVFLTQLGDLAKKKSLNLLEILRRGKIEVQESLGRDAIKSQLKVAEKTGAEIALILGQKEALDNTVIVREINSGIQETVPQGKLIDFLNRKLKKEKEE